MSTLDPEIELYIDGNLITTVRLSELKMLESMGFIERKDENTFVLTDTGVSYIEQVLEEEKEEDDNGCL